jgi:hypothetical protein
MGISVAKASATLAGLANDIQAAIEDSAKKGFRLAEEIRVVDRTHLERDVESMKLKTKDRRSDFFETARELLMEGSNQWFAFFHVQQ